MNPSSVILDRDPTNNDCVFMNGAVVNQCPHDLVTAQESSACLDALAQADNPDPYIRPNVTRLSRDVHLPARERGLAATGTALTNFRFAGSKS